MNAKKLVVPFLQQIYADSNTAKGSVLFLSLEIRHPINTACSGTFTAKVASAWLCSAKGITGPADGGGRFLFILFKLKHNKQKSIKPENGKNSTF